MKVLATRFIPIVLLITVLATGGISCYRGSVESANTRVEMPFYTDRVVTVRITMAAEDWAFLQANAMAEQYVRADIWYGEKRLRDVAVRPKGNSSLRMAVRQGSKRISLKVDLNFFNAAGNLDG